MLPVISYRTLNCRHQVCRLRHWKTWTPRPAIPSILGNDQAKVYCLHYEGHCLFFLLRPCPINANVSFANGSTRKDACHLPRYLILSQVNRWVISRLYSKWDSWQQWIFGVVVPWCWDLIIGFFLVRSGCGHVWCVWPLVFGLGVQLLSIGSLAVDLTIECMFFPTLVPPRW